MFFTNLKRILNFGWQSFKRNKGLGFGVIFTISVSIFIITCLFISYDGLKLLISDIQKKFDISVSFKKEISENEILNVKDELLKNFFQIGDIEYISAEKALEVFKERHKNDPTYLEALEEVGDNPFPASLNIRAKNLKGETPTLYAQISNFLSQEPFSDLIDKDKISYFENKKIIDRIFSLMALLKKLGIGLIILAAFLVVSITFWTIKLSINNFREEIKAMNLVGASDFFVKGPFIVQTFIYGIFAVLIVNLVFYLSFYFLNQKIYSFLNFDVAKYFQEKFLLLLLIQVIFGIVLAGISSFVAVTRYLKQKT